MEPERIHNGTMPVTLSVKNVPDMLAERLRRRATSHLTCLANFGPVEA